MDNELESLASANVRMVLLTSSIQNLREEEHRLFNGGDIEVFYDAFLTELMSVCNAKYAALGLFLNDGRLREFRTVGMDSDAINKIGIRPEGKGVLKEVYKGEKIIRIDNISNHQASCGFPDGHPEMKSLIGIPVKINAKISGVIYLADRRDGLPFNDTDEELIKIVILELENVLERRTLLSQLASKNLMLGKEKKEQELLLETINEIQNQLLQSEKMASIGQLAAGVAHEINNPVGYVNSNISSLDGYLNNLLSLVKDITKVAAEKDVLQDEISGLKENIDYDFIQDDVQQLLEESKEGVSRVKKIVQDLKDFSHVDEDEWQWADIHKGIDSTLNVVNNEIKYKAEVIKEYGDLPEIECIASQLNQVFMNLFVNASHAIESQGTITIRTGRDNADNVYIEVIDTGKGIEDQHLKKLFDPFFSTKPVGEGTGLGLSLSYSIIQKHGGRIEVESELKKGTKFTVWLPIKQDEKEVDIELFNKD